MVIFLTSSFIPFQSMEEYVPTPIDESNGFGDNLRKYWKEHAHVLVFACDPSDTKLTTHIAMELQNAFTLSGFSIDEIRGFDNQYILNYSLAHSSQTKDSESDEIACSAMALCAMKEALEWADVLFLSGGHAPTENEFMKKCGLKELLSDTRIFDGILIGISAGSVNAASEVYLIPELPGESVNPDFVRFTDGLGLTGVNMVPHFQYTRTLSLDGKDLVGEIVASDSYNRRFYLVEDGSYFMIRNGITEFFGQGMVMENGLTYPLAEGVINSDNQRFHQAYTTLLDACASDTYDWVLEFHAGSGRINFFYISSSFLAAGIIPIHLDTFDELNQLFTDKLVVFDEKESYLEQVRIPIILNELKTKGSFARTVHIDTPIGILAENLRILPLPNDPDRFLVTLADISLILDHDWMTDEYSRSGFLSRTRQILSQDNHQNNYAIVYANIKGFKGVNDLLGTQSGDRVIFFERDTLMWELHPVLIARLESDHFALLTEIGNITPDSMNRVCYQCYTEGTKQLPIQIRCGIYEIKDPSESIPHMLDQAKLAEKSIITDRGIPYAICNKKMSQDYFNQQVLLSEIDKAFEKEEFIPYFQPIVDAKTQKIVSAEALIRWNHSKKGMISPGQFIPVLEKEGLITRIDTFMVNRILDFNTKRLKQGKCGLPCAVNLSRVDFYDTKLMDMFRRKIGNIENVHNMLKLEVTESAYAVLESDALAFLEEMRRLRLSLLLDDFGSGMSSLSTLESLAFDTVKLDMGFIAKIGKSAKAEAIIRHTIGMSHDMGSKVIAEGVEHKEQLQFLQSVGCDMIQGYYFYKPMPEDEFIKLLP